MMQWTNVNGYVVHLRRDFTGMLVADVPDLPGCHTQGKTRREAVANVREAIEAYRESLKGA